MDPVNLSTLAVSLMIFIERVFDNMSCCAGVRSNTTLDLTCSKCLSMHSDFTNRTPSASPHVSDRT